MFKKIDKLLDIERCNYYSNLLQSLVKERKTEIDSQVEGSEIIYCYPDFDALLEELLPIVEKETGKTLYPTYSFARLYRTGTELKVHTDRPSCEYSITVTLGYEGDKWAIYMGDKEDKSDGTPIYMNVGEGVVYEGTKHYHWREPFTGKWQAQVFLHYVDANGPYAEYRYDKRDKLAHHPNKRPNYYIEKNYFSKEACDAYISKYKNSINIQSGNIANGVVNKNIRNVSSVLLEPNKGIVGVLNSLAMNLNNHFWQYDIRSSHQGEFLMYDKDGKYEAHIDTIENLDEPERKLTALAFLNDDYKGGQFYIQTSHNKDYIDVGTGDVLVFPSFKLHGVEPVTEGVRYSVVSWINGPLFK